MNADQRHSKHCSKSAGPLVFALWLATTPFGAGIRAAIVVGPSSGVPPGVTNASSISAERSADRPPERPPNDRLTLTGGEWLSGSLVSARNDTGELVWRHGAIRELLSVRLQAVTEVQLAVPGAARRRSSADSVVRLTNGDELFGRILSLDSNSLVIADTAAGTLRLVRAMVAEFSPAGGAGEVLYEGPSSLEEWALRGDRSRQWALSEGGLIPLNPSPIGRVIEGMGDRVRIDFSIDWKFFPGFLSFWFFHEKPEEPQGDAYMLNIVAAQRLELNRMRAGGGSQGLGGVEIGEWTGGAATMRVTIFADRRRGEIAVSVNDRVVRQWKDTRDFRGTGNAITFMPQGGRELRLSEIRVVRWTGRLAPPSESAERVDSDVVVLANGDTMSGRVLTVGEGRLRLETPFAPLEVPVERVAQVIFAAESQLRARRRPSDVRLRLVRGGQITMTLREIDSRVIRGESENFGIAEVPLEAVQRIQFNLYGPAVQRLVP
ncbi:MAG: hypothetical protein N2652_00790 [Kiritimatiellae bacterium]|nr:hypothetical protein [Kiritimatiellia bacterium]